MSGVVAPTATIAPPASRTPSESYLRRAWRRIPYASRMRLFELTHRTGVPFLLSYLANHRAWHHPSRFAGRIPELQEEYPLASPARRIEILERFDAIADSIILPNGVRKTSYGGRVSALLRRLLLDPACALPERRLRVLDLPASTGATATETIEILAASRDLAEYVLADLSFDLLYDRARDCIFDARGKLLQQGGARSFTSVNLPHCNGVESSPVVRMVLWPLVLRRERLRRALRACDAARLDSFPLLRPDVLERLRAGAFSLQEFDVFGPIPGSYDLILTFNLLQRNYFGSERIEAGIANLAKALAPDGLLIVGRPDAEGADAHRVYRRIDDRIVLIRSRDRL